jgi:peptidyl-prolyl cis-trans isomerase A (cyclophilin A)
MKFRLKEVFALCFALVLKVNAQTPVITSQPQSITVNNASAAAFTVVASNAVTYQWVFQGTNNLPGETNATLSLDDVSTNQAGSYTVVVTSSNNISVTSAPPAVLTLTNGTIIQITISTYPNGSTNSFQVQLFDHDKPATVENFIHYITSGSYSNMFFDRDVTNFVLQGGDYVSADRLTNGLDVHNVSPSTNSPFPTSVDNEFSVGPLIHNRFGTVAMALQSGKTNSATGAFYFNLVDNSAALDPQDFTVFGRILPGPGTNDLEYFNTLTAPSGGIYTGFSGVPTLPVNYDGTQPPTDASFYYCDFTFITGPPVDTTPPTVSITFPTPDANFTNGGDLTVTGTSSDNVAVAQVYCVLTPLTGESAGFGETNDAIGTTQWFLDLGTNPPGIYELTAYAQDGVGNLSTPATVYFTNLAVLTIITNVNGALTTNDQYLVPGQSYSFTETPPSAGDVFLNWQNQGVVSLDPEQTITTETNLTLTVTFAATNGFPPGLAITSPVANSTVVATNAALVISGTLPSSGSVTNITVQLFLESNAVMEAESAVINGSTWSLAESNLDGGYYTVIAVAEDSAGQQGVATENFTALAPPIIISQPSSVTNLVGSTAEFSVIAENAASYQWQLVGTGPIPNATNATLAIPNVTSNLSGSSYFVVITSAQNETVTSATATLTVVAGTLVQITFSGYADGSTSNVVVQLFDYAKPATVANFLHYIMPANESGYVTNVAYSNMIWDRCLPGFVLQGGDYNAIDRTNTTPPPYLQNINSVFTQNEAYSPQFPSNIDSEFYVGPVIHNTFGTLAMAITPGQPDTASSSFFINLADNSARLETSNSVYTVFGQIISGSNVLQYFNTLSKPNEGIFDSTTAGLGQGLPGLPVNYHGWTVPTDSNLFFGTFTLLTAFNADTVAPMVTMDYPTNGQTATNANVIFQGTASDNVAVARVILTLNGNTIQATGTTNWTADVGALRPGTYTYKVAAQDGSGNITSPTNQVTGTIVVPRFPFDGAVNGNGTLSTNLNGTNTTVGATYKITALPDKGDVFVNWVMGSNTFLSPTTNFTMQNGLQMTANFISNVVPGGVSITFPRANEELAGTNFSMAGKVAPSLGAAQVTCQIFAANTSNSVSGPMIVNTSSTWTTPSVALAPGDYIVQAVAQGANHAAVATERFTVLAQLTIVQYGHGKVSIRSGTYLKVNSVNLISATAAAGNSFLSWNGGGGSIPDSILSFPMSAGLTLTATFVSNSVPNKLTFTSPIPNSELTNKNVTFTGKVNSSLVAPQVLCQVFQDNFAYTGFAPATMNGNQWTLTVSNLTIGGYNAVAMVTDAAGQTTLATERFVINFYPLIKGIYYGLFFDPANVTGTNAGTVAFALGNIGQVDGTLSFGNVSYPKHPPYLLYFIVGPSGSTTIQAQTTLQNPGLLPSLTFNFDLVNFTGVMNGYIALGNDVYPMTAYRAVRKLSTNTIPSPGNYVLNLESENPGSGPPGDGFANVIASPSGSLAVAGTLADNTPFSFSTGVGTNGVWPLFASFYKGNAMLIGWETNLPSGDCSGSLYWIKAPTNGLYYTNGINEQLNSFGTNYVAPAAGVNYQIVFAGGTLATPVTNVCTFKNGLIIPASGTTDKLMGTLSTKGVLKGSIVNPFNNEKLPFNGAFISPAEGGAGFTLYTNKQTGYFQVGLAP